MGKQTKYIIHHRYIKSFAIAFQNFRRQQHKRYLPPIPKYIYKHKMDKPTGSSHLNMTLGGVLCAGGLAGYVKAKSMPSLIAGFGLGALYFGSGVLINRGKSAQGHASAIVPSVVLTGAMGQKAITSGFKPMPSALAVVGVLATLYNGKKYLEWRE